MSHEAALKQIKQIKEWAETKGLPMEGMYENQRDVDFLWWVIQSEGSVETGAFNHFEDKTLAKKSVEQLKAEGKDTFFIGGESAGSNNVAITNSLLETSFLRRLYLMLHEATHVWDAKFFGEKKQGKLREALAEYITYELMKEWAKENDPTLSDDVDEYVTLSLELYVAIEELKIAINSQANLDQAVEYFLKIGKKLKKNYSIVRPGDQLNSVEDINSAVLWYYYRYSSITAKVKEYFENQDLAVEDLLKDPFPHEAALLEIANSNE